jgi:hypothetical protein
MDSMMMVIPNTFAWVRKTRCTGRAGVLLAVVALLAIQQGLSAQLTYRSGQRVFPAYEGWEEDDDGSRYFLFGYMNANWEEELDVPVGPDNFVVAVTDDATSGGESELFMPTMADQGQPTRFLPRRNRFVFRVPVPDGVEELHWTLTTVGETATAYATLAIDYRVDNLIKASEQGAIGAGSSNPTIRANKLPELNVEGETERTARVGEPLTLVAVATDDGVPESRQGRRLRRGRRTADGVDTNPLWRKPGQGTVGSARGLRLSWYVYRGSGNVTFEPLQTKVWEDSRAHANSPWANFWETPPLPEDDTWRVDVTFHEPGTYVLRCLASDGAIAADSDVTVTVTE